MRKRYFILLLMSLLFTACSSSDKRSGEQEKLVRSNAVFISNGEVCQVTIPETEGEIVFKSLEEDRLLIDIALKVEGRIERLLIFDGEDVLRIRAVEGEFVLAGEQLEKFKGMIEENKGISLKGRIESYNYFSQKLSKEDTEVINQIFEESQI
ncbi:hypothetical protein PM10SUCC1_20670 [Propionigenium maris DSM 9537]|uniref:Uncharacterized protein n=1 Tax=Propionigenium maris DSM 9537 TaxID=1123000 RepID=A0A9W6LNF5_9FUSO|nr:hypothetical protein [Propionigenium maris]GLI56553.1 hypothetical protein PM10SUCC1_20670 [Propionigenium maris DSM 9537]